MVVLFAFLLHFKLCFLIRQTMVSVCVIFSPFHQQWKMKHLTYHLVSGSGLLISSKASLYTSSETKLSADSLVDEGRLAVCATGNHRLGFRVLISLFQLC